MLEGKRIIVTGAARGMGEATLSAYVGSGANVVAMDINEKMGKAVVGKIHETGPGSAFFTHIDVADKNSVEQSFSKAVALLDGLDVLAHPAAIQAASAAFWMNHQSIALGNKYGDPLTDLGPVMVFFASDASRFITGQLIPVDGGQTNTR